MLPLDPVMFPRLPHLPTPTVRLPRPLRPGSLPVLLFALLLVACQGAGEGEGDGAEEAAAADRGTLTADGGQPTRDTSGDTAGEGDGTAAGQGAGGASTASSDRPPASGVSGGREAQRETLVVVQPLRIGAVRDQVLVSARVESDDVVQVFPMLTSLPITEVLVDEGDTVEAGQVLMRLYDIELAIAEASAAASADQAAKEVRRQELLLAEAEARIRRNERAQLKQQEDLDRLEGLVGDGLVNVQEVEDARLLAEQASDDLELARFARDGAEVDLELARIREAQAQLDFERAQADHSHCTVRAPLSGIVAERTVEVGELSGQTMAAFRVVDLERPILKLRAPQDALDRLAEGQRVEVRSVTGADLNFEGAVRRVNPVLDEATGTISVIVDLVPAPGLVPGLFVEARIITAAREAAVLVDKRAVRYEDDQAVFFTLDASGDRVTQVAFAPGAATSTEIEVLEDLEGQPVTADQKVVIVGHENLKDGSRVRVQEEAY